MIAGFLSSRISLLRGFSLARCGFHICELASFAGFASLRDLLGYAIFLCRDFLLSRDILVCLRDFMCAISVFGGRVLLCASSLAGVLLCGLYVRDYNMSRRVLLCGLF